MSEKIKRNREEKKLSMILSFIKVFCEQGLDGAFMRKLASSAGVSEGLLYRYFENKDDIIRQCTAFYHEQIQRELTDVMITYFSRPDLMPIKILEYIDGVIDVCRFLLQVMAHPTYNTMMEETRRKVNENILQVAKLFEETTTLSADSAIGAAFLLNSIVNDYILKKSRENFLIQFSAVRLLAWGNG